MKRISAAFILIGFLIVAVAGCRHNSFNNALQGNEPDSLYTGKKYVVQIPFKFPPVENKYADSMTYEGVELGRRLFYDKHLSADGKKSCASCHLLQYAMSDSGNAQSMNETGLTKRNAPALQNLLWGRDFFWDGKVKTLDAQAKDAAHNEMAMAPDVAIGYLKNDSGYVGLFKKAFGRPGDITEAKIDKALEQFMMSIVSCNAKFDRVKRGEERFTASEQRGLQIFSGDTGGCFRCHNSGGGASLLLTDNLFRNNGLDSVNTAYQFADSGRGGVTHVLSDYGLFKVPTLRNVAVTGPYMHDGRYKTLQQVISFYSDSTRLSPSVDPNIIYVFKGKNEHHLTAQQKSDLLNFLYTLTDSSFIHNAALMDPFK
jgi:cytochrome c peroxidase